MTEWVIELVFFRYQKKKEVLYVICEWFVSKYWCEIKELINELINSLNTFFTYVLKLKITPPHKKRIVFCSGSL